LYIIHLCIEQAIAKKIAADDKEENSGGIRLEDFIGNVSNEAILICKAVIEEYFQWLYNIGEDASIPQNGSMNGRNFSYITKVFASDYPEKTLEMFKESLILYADNNTGRSYYEHILSLLKKMSRIKGGKKPYRIWLRISDYTTRTAGQ